MLLRVHHHHHHPHHHHHHHHFFHHHHHHNLMVIILIKIIIIIITFFAGLQARVVFSSSLREFFTRSQTKLPFNQENILTYLSFQEYMLCNTITLATTMYFLISSERFLLSTVKRHLSLYYFWPNKQPLWYHDVFF